MSSAKDGPVAAAAESPQLSGIRILDFSHILAGPFCTRLLADLGAEVLKVETDTRPERMGATRIDPTAKRRQDRPPSFLNVNRNKRSITINLKTEKGRALATQLATKADIVVENFSAEVMKRLGLAYEQLQPLNPRLIYVSMSGFGHYGPRKDWTSMNMSLQAYTGLMMVTGAEGDLPTAISNSWNDYIGGLHACHAVLEALEERETTGLGRNLDLAQFECSVATIAPLVIASAFNGEVPPRLGSRSTHAAPQGCYRSAGKDEWCVISVENDAQWKALAAALGNPEWVVDTRFSSLAGRIRHHDELDRNLEAWTSQLPPIEIERRLKAAGVPCERMRRMNEIVGSPDAGDVYRWMEDPPSRTLATGLPFEFRRTPTAPLSPAPRVGEHTQAALKEWLGMAEPKIAELSAAGVLA
jgi:crotonobetainyl-CoA:carnitine CoA-transferase CaiB-like acyl-CoA transferase